MAKYTTSFFLGGAFLGQSPRDSAWYHEQAGPPLSLAYFCPQCGEVWGRAVVTRADGVQIPFHVVTRECATHSPASHIFPGGTFGLSWDKDFTASLPDRVIAHDFARHLAIFDERNTTDA